VNPLAAKYGINRRAFLRGAGGVAIGLPFLEGLPERSAWAQSQKPVFAFFICTANGVVQQYQTEPEKFWPTDLGPLTTATMQAFAADRCTGILADHAAHLLFVKGVNYPYSVGGCGHANGLVMCLTSSKPSGSNNTVVSTGISADTAIAQQVNPTGVEPLTLYSGMKQGYIDEKLSFSTAGQVRAAEGNPYNVYQRLMGLAQPGGATTTMADQLALRRKSVNDVVRDELNTLRSRPDLSKADKDRLDQHFQSIRDIETTMMAMGLQCSADGLDIQAINAMNTNKAFSQNGVIEDVAKLQMALVAFAFACNATRVATLQIGDGTDETNYTIDGVKIERFHWVSHRVQSDQSTGAPIPEALTWHTAIDRLRMSTLKYMLDKWATYSTPNGPLLDNAFALWTNHVAQGPSHSFKNLPMIIAGSAGGYLKQGQYIDAGGATNNKLLNTLITAAGGRKNGGPVDNFGGADLAGGLIPGMLA
jgi:hypothetical protein